MFRRGGGGLNPYLSEYLTRLAAEGGSITGAEQGYLNTFLNSIQASEFDRLWVHGLSNQIAARISLVNALTADLITEVNAPTFTAGVGFTGDGTTDYLDLNFQPSTDGIKYTLNDCSFGVYTQDNVEGGYILGTGSGANFVGIRTKLTGNFTAEINSLSSVIGVSPSANGFWSVGRTGSTNPFVYRNGSSLTINTNPSLASTGLPANEVTCLAYGGTPTSTNTVSINFFGSANYNQVDFNTAIQSLAVSLGFDV